MNALPISQSVEDALVNYLGDKVYGLMPAMQSLANNYQNPPDLPVINWDGDTSQVYRLWMSANDLIANGIELFPAVMIHVNQTIDMKIIKSMDFSGAVMAVVDFILSSGENGLPVALQMQANIVNDAIYRVFGVDRYTDLQKAGITLNGGIQVIRTPQQPGGMNWIQTVSCQLPLKMDVFGAF